MQEIDEAAAPCDYSEDADPEGLFGVDFHDVHTVPHVPVPLDDENEVFILELKPSFKTRNGARAEPE